ncbi:MAG: 50S ribosomal protein L9 [Alphaproteobacteria bacterium]
MEVILLERIEKLGQMGDVVSVKPGYARNCLLPQNKALRATEGNRTHFETQRAQLEAANLENRTEAEKVGKKLDGTIVVLTRQAGEAGQLYGSVNARDIADQITEAGFTVDRQQVDLGQPIKMIGLHEVAVKLHPEVSVSVVANVARSADEAAIQAETGKAVLGADEEEAAEAKIAAEEVFEKAEDAEAADEGATEEAHGEEAADAEEEKAD